LYEKGSPEEMDEFMYQLMDLTGNAHIQRSFFFSQAVFPKTQSFLIFGMHLLADYCIEAKNC
jgi:hypothetical protein